MVTPATLPFSGELIPLVEQLAEDPRWRVNVENAGLLFVAQSQGDGLFALDKREIWRQMQREAPMVVSGTPGRARRTGGCGALFAPRGKAPCVVSQKPLTLNSLPQCLDDRNLGNSQSAEESSQTRRHDTDQERPNHYGRD